MTIKVAIVYRSGHSHAAISPRMIILYGQGLVGRRILQNLDVDLGHPHHGRHHAPCFRGITGHRLGQSGIIDLPGEPSMTRLLLQLRLVFAAADFLAKTCSTALR